MLSSMARGTMMLDGSAFARKLSQFIPLNERELAKLATLERPSQPFASGTELVYEHEIGHRAFILQQGWACSYKLLADGGRQIIDVAVPGDVLGLRSILLRTSDQAVAAVTDIAVAEVTERTLTQTFYGESRLGTAILWAASRDQAMVVEHLVNLGRRSALARTAHFLIELGLRLQLVGLASEDGYACPLTQYVLGDTLGLTAVHLNRVLRQLRDRRLLVMQKGHVRILDSAGLRSAAGYNSGYLDERPTEASLTTP
jgi:CRP-like cAMP-binding protein